MTRSGSSSRPSGWAEQPRRATATAALLTAAESRSAPPAVPRRRHFAAQSGAALPGRAEERLLPTLRRQIQEGETPGVMPRKGRGAQSRRGDVFSLAAGREKRCRKRKKAPLRSVLQRSVFRPSGAVTGDAGRDIFPRSAAQKVAVRRDIFFAPMHRARRAGKTFFSAPAHRIRRVGETFFFAQRCGRDEKSACSAAQSAGKRRGTGQDIFPRSGAQSPPREGDIFCVRRRRGALCGRNIFSRSPAETTAPAGPFPPARPAKKAAGPVAAGPAERGRYQAAAGG